MLRFLVAYQTLKIILNEMCQIPIFYNMLQYPSRRVLYDILNKICYCFNVERERERERGFEFREIK